MNRSATLKPLISRIQQSSIFVFVVSRYISYFVLFFRGILIAKFLGTFLFGIWGFLMLTQQYLAYTGLGLPYAISVELSVESLNDKGKQAKYIGNSLFLTAVISLILIGIAALIHVENLPIFTKYNFQNYVFLISLVVGLNHFFRLFINIYRAIGSLWRIIVAEFLNALIPLIVLLIYRDSPSIIIALLLSLAGSNLIGVGILSIKSPFPITPQFDFELIKYTVSKGIPLLIYNLGFALIFIAGKTIVSIFYSIEELGVFTLANSITNAVLLGFQAITWAVAPSILMKTRTQIPDTQAREIVDKVNELYSTTVFLIVYCIILSTPLLTLVLPEYAAVIPLLNILLLMQAVLSVVFGYNSIAIARNHAPTVARISIVSAMIVIIVTAAIGYLHFPLLWLALTMLVGSLLFVVFQARLGARLMNNGQLPPKYLLSILPPENFLVMFFFIIGSFVGYSSIFGLIGLALFLSFRLSSLKKVWQFAMVKIQDLKFV